MQHKPMPSEPLLQGRTCFETLRSLAYSTLADLVHDVRDKLNLTQLARIVYLFSRNIHDHTLPLGIQVLNPPLVGGPVSLCPTPLV